MKATAFLLPDKMIIETLNKKDAGTWYSTGECTMLALDTSNSELGVCVLNHLHQSKEEEISYDRIKENWKLVIRKAKFKTEKSFLQNVKRVSVKVESNKIIFEPFKTNIQQKMFYRIQDGITEIEYVPRNAETTGKELRNSWSKCITVN